MRKAEHRHSLSRTMAALTAVACASVPQPPSSPHLAQLRQRHRHRHRRRCHRRLISSRATTEKPTKSLGTSTRSPSTAPGCRSGPGNCTTGASPPSKRGATSCARLAQTVSTPSRCTSSGACTKNPLTASSTSPALKTSTNCSPSPKRRVCTSSPGPAPTSTPKSPWAASPPP